MCGYRNFGAWDKPGHKHTHTFCSSAAAFRYCNTWSWIHEGPFKDRHSDLLLDLLQSVVLTIAVIIEGRTAHHIDGVVNGGIFLQEGAVEVLPDL